MDWKWMIERGAGVTFTVISAPTRPLPPTPLPRPPLNTHTNPMTLKVSTVPRGVGLFAIKGRSWLRKYIFFCNQANITSVWFLFSIYPKFPNEAHMKIVHTFPYMCSQCFLITLEKKKNKGEFSHEMMANHPVPRIEKSILHPRESKHAHIANRFADLKLLVRWILGTFHDTVGCPADFPLTHDSQAVIYIVKEIQAADQIFKSVRNVGNKVRSL